MGHPACPCFLVIEQASTKNCIFFNGLKPKPKLKEVAKILECSNNSNNSVLGSDKKMSNSNSLNPILQPAVASIIQPLSTNNLLSGQSEETGDIIGYGYGRQISGNNVVWSWYDSDSNDHEIYFWNGSTTTQVTNNSTYDYEPQISGNNVVWYGYDGNDHEIYFWNGSTTTQVTNNSTEDYEPQISGNNVVWLSYT